MSGQKQTALVLAGGVAKGAFEAGALRVLTEAGVTFGRIVAASSGVLNGALMAAAVRAGREREAARRLVTLWENEADWKRVFRFTARGIFAGHGISTSDKVIARLRREVGAILEGGERRPIGLHIVVTALAGATGFIGRKPATTFEEVVHFDEGSFDAEGRRERVIQTAAASAAFPGIFEPIDLPGVGPCVDGGIVNNAPIGLAIDCGCERVIVISPYPMTEAPRRRLALSALVSRLGDALIRERLYRDLRAAERVNRRLDWIAELERTGSIMLGRDEAVRRSLGLGRKVEIVTICPEKDLEGDALAGFFNRRLRMSYIAAGAEAATRALGQLG